MAPRLAQTSRPRAIAAMLSLASGRDILLCDLGNPKDPVHALLMVADSSAEIQGKAIAILLRSEPGRPFSGERHDCGHSVLLSPLGQHQVRTRYIP